MPETSPRTDVTLIDTGNRPLPHNEEAEIAVLGCMLCDPDRAMDLAIALLNFEGNFYKPAHQTIFSALAELSNDPQAPAVDQITLADSLARKGKLEEAGGRAYIAQIAYSVPTAANIEHYAEIVRQNAVLRRLIASCIDITSRCYDAREDIAELVDGVESEILKITGLSESRETVPVKDLLLDAVTHLDDLRRGKKEAMGLPTGYPDLDNIITGLREGEMTVLAARPSIGKTALALNMASRLALGSAHIPVGFFSLEMNAKMIVLRLLCSHARISMADIRDGALSAARWQGIVDSAQALGEGNILIDDSSGLDIIELRARARRMKQKSDIRILFIDYLQLITAPGGRNSTRENEVSRISGGIKALAKELNVPIVVLAQLNRQAEQHGQHPRLSHLRESGAIEQDADVVALLHRDREGQGDQEVARSGMEAELIIAKNRNGPTGLVPLTFVPAYAQFESRARISNQDMEDL